jgi:cyanoexosortase A
MKAMYFSSAKYLKQPQFWLSVLAVALGAIHLTLSLRQKYIYETVINVLVYLAVASLLWEKRRNFCLETEVIPAFLGALLIGFILLKTTFMTDDYFLVLFPFVSAFGLSLLASGFKGLIRYPQELILLFFTGLPKILISSLLDIPILTAKFATFLLWYSGFEVSNQGVNILLPTGTVEVGTDCSGRGAMSYLLTLAVIFLVMFPTKRNNNILVPIVAVIIGFVVNGIRVALMAILVATSNQELFRYWHERSGSLIFAMIEVSLLGLFCLFLLRQEEVVADDSVEPKNY